jgi:hypothetical protein
MPSMCASDRTLSACVDTTTVLASLTARTCQGSGPSRAAEGGVRRAQARPGLVVWRISPRAEAGACRAVDLQVWQLAVGGKDFGRQVLRVQHRCSLLEGVRVARRSAGGSGSAWAMQVGC